MIYTTNPIIFRFLIFHQAECKSKEFLLILSETLEFKGFSSETTYSHNLNDLSQEERAVMAWNSGCKLLEFMS